MTAQSKTHARAHAHAHIPTHTSLRKTGEERKRDRAMTDIAVIMYHDLEQRTVST